MMQKLFEIGSGIPDFNVSELAEQLIGKTVTSVDADMIVLDDDEKLYIKEDADTDCCAWENLVLTTQENIVGGVITNVKMKTHDTQETEEGGLSITIYHELKELARIEENWGNNGYYGTAVSFVIEKLEKED